MIHLGTQGAGHFEDGKDKKLGDLADSREYP